MGGEDDLILFQSVITSNYLPDNLISRHEFVHQIKLEHLFIKLKMLLFSVPHGHN